MSPTINIGPKIRRGIAELNGEGEVVGGVIVMRFGENAQRVIDGVKARLETLKAGLPDGVEIVTVYDRSQLIDSAVKNLYTKLVEEFLVVAWYVRFFCSTFAHPWLRYFLCRWVFLQLISS